MSREREGLLRLYGARVEITVSLGGMDEAVQAARAMAQSPDVFLPDQFSNPANPDIHRRTTGPEILQALDNRVDVLVAGVGTGGTITGVGECLKAVNPRALVIAVEPASSAVLTVAGESDPENLTPRTPVRVEQGTADTTVLPVFTNGLVADYKQNGVDVTYKTYDGVTHGGVVDAGAKDATGFIKRRLK
jgi:cysteine synthase